jgi:hypothetical protein
MGIGIGSTLPPVIQKQQPQQPQGAGPQVTPPLRPPVCPANQGVSDFGSASKGFSWLQFQGCPPAQAGATVGSIASSGLSAEQQAILDAARPSPQPPPPPPADAHQAAEQLSDGILGQLAAARSGGK